MICNPDEEMDAKNLLKYVFLCKWRIHWNVPTAGGTNLE
jgi:hypothetical protein